MNAEKLKEIIEKHGKWLRGEEGGERARLDGQNLNYASLNGASLIGASLIGASLNYASLNGASLNGASLIGASLNGASLIGASLIGASLNYASLNRASLDRASLNGASLNGASLNYASLNYASLNRASLDRASLDGALLDEASLIGASLDGAVNLPYIPMACPDTGAFIGWKKASGRIVKLLIPEDARRSSATGRKCRCDKAKVLAIENLDGTDTGLSAVHSDYDNSFLYTVGEIVKPDIFCEVRFIECRNGIHFFINRQEAVDYNL